MLPKRVINNTIWLEPYIEENKSASKLIFLEKKVNRGVVVKVGEGCDKSILEEVNVGDVIIFEPHHPSKITLGNKEYLVLKDINCLAIVPKDSILEIEELPQLDKLIGNF